MERKRNPGNMGSEKHSPDSTSLHPGYKFNA